MGQNRENFCPRKFLPAKVDISRDIEYKATVRKIVNKKLKNMADNKETQAAWARGRCIEQDQNGQVGRWVIELEHVWGEDVQSCFVDKRELLHVYSSKLTKNRVFCTYLWLCPYFLKIISHKTSQNISSL